MAAPVPIVEAARLASYIQARHARREVFGDLFADPAWDVLLGLFLCEQLGERVTVSSACMWGDVAPATAHRHIAALDRAGLIVRVPDGVDKRRTWIELTDHARRMWARWNCELQLWRLG